MGRLANWWIHVMLERTIALGAGVLAGLFALCTVFVHFEEGWGWIDSAYFAMVSITTVGYGDLVPSHEATRLFLVFYLPIGIGVGLTVLASLGAKILDAQRRRYERMHRAMDAHEEPNRGSRPP